MGDRLSDDELDEALAVAQSLNSLRLTAAVAELKERRAQDLTGEELQAIDDLVYVWNCRESNRMLERERIALRAFTKLLKQRTGGAVQSDTCNTRGNR